MSAARIHGIVLSGVGGQGVLSLAQIVLEALRRSGFHALQSEIHGMSQRGGSVTSDVRFGRAPADRVGSPMVPAGEADFLVVLAPSEVEVNRATMRPGGVLIAPELVPEGELANKRSLNVALLGALSTYLELPREAFMEAIAAALPEKLRLVNEQAFELGRKLAAEHVTIT